MHDIFFVLPACRFMLSLLTPSASTCRWDTSSCTWLPTLPTDISTCLSASLALLCISWKKTDLFVCHHDVLRTHARLKQWFSRVHYASFSLHWCPRSNQVVHSEIRSMSSLPSSAKAHTEQWRFPYRESHAGAQTHPQWSAPFCFERTFLLYAHSPIYARVCSLAQTFSVGSLQTSLGRLPSLFLEAKPAHVRHQMRVRSLPTVTRHCMRCPTIVVSSRRSPSTFLLLSLHTHGTLP